MTPPHVARDGRHPRRTDAVIDDAKVIVVMPAYNDRSKATRSPPADGAGEVTCPTLCFEEASSS